ncbi:hypothetical protein BDN72DRAFT_965644 [Pluteus cervinus]|uniref:Uncharacterized protein n=1 Tax=Pluteus cervinus TaxID=181527 RepID=A0ACD3A4R3_9AGAR|nr:hypothetical protein BDN72DRAFT_965644 [Pluteus cervinus]
MFEPPPVQRLHVESAESCTPHLPPELEAYIFELAARLSLSTAATLLQVAHRAAEWVYPALYQTVVIYPSDYRPFRFTDNIRTFQQYGRYVRHLLISSAATEGDLSNLSVNPDKIISVLSYCPYMTSLALWCGPVTTRVLQMLQTLPLRHLSIDIGPSLLIDLPNVTFPYLTHIELISASQVMDWSVLSIFPKLTHVAVGDMEGHDHVVRGIVENCRTLTTFVIVGYGFNREVVNADESRQDGRDTRIVGVYCDYVFDWLRCVAGERDMWTAAEEELARRRLILNSVDTPLL